MTRTRNRSKSKQKEQKKRMASEQPSERAFTENVTHKYNALRNCCLEPFEWFQQFGELHDTPNGRYIYRHTPGAKVLAVAHLDSVDGAKHFHVIQQTKGTLVHTATLDDRLGAWLILYVLNNERFGMKYDVLLTEGEEHGLSTAEYFKPAEDAEYNWGFECDRTGTDVVMYDFETNALRQRLSAAGFKIGQGSFTDICKLEHLGVEMFNVGVAYYDYHSWRAYAILEETIEQMFKLKKYYDAHKDTKFPHEAIRQGRLINGRWDDWRESHNGGYYTHGQYGTTAQNMTTWRQCNRCRIAYQTATANGNSIMQTGYCVNCNTQMELARQHANAAHAKKEVKGWAFERCTGCSEVFYYHVEADREDAESVNNDGLCINCLGAMARAKERLKNKGSVTTMGDYTTECPSCHKHYLTNTNPGTQAGSIKINGVCLACFAKAEKTHCEFCGKDFLPKTKDARAISTFGACTMCLLDGADKEEGDLIECPACSDTYVRGGVNAAAIKHNSSCLDCLLSIHQGKNPTRHKDMLMADMVAYIEQLVEVESRGMIATKERIEWKVACDGCEREYSPTTERDDVISIDETGKCLSCRTGATENADVNTTGGSSAQNTGSGTQDQGSGEDTRPVAPVTDQPDVRPTDDNTPTPR